MLRVFLNLKPYFGVGRVLRRTLFTEESLGLDKYVAMMEFTKKKYNRQRTEEFWDRLDAVLNRPSTSNQLILSADVKDALLLADDKRLDALESVVDIYDAQCDNYRLYPLNWKPMMLFCFHRLKLGDKAMDFLEKWMNKGDISLQCFVIAADLMYEMGRYDDVIRIYDMYAKSSKIENGVKFPLTLQVTVAAACYKMGTEDSLNKFVEFLKRLTDENVKIHTKIVTYLAALSYKTHKYTLAYEYMFLVESEAKSAALRSLQIMLQSRLNKFDEALKELEGILLDSAHLDPQECSVCREAITVLSKGLKVRKNAEGSEKLAFVCKLLEQGKQIIDTSIEELVCTDISLIRTASIDVELVERDSEPSLIEPNNPYMEKGNTPLGSLESFVLHERKTLAAGEKNILEQAVKALKKEGPLEEEHFDEDVKIRRYEEFVKRGLSAKKIE